jgi:putative membrane protein
MSIIWNLLILTIAIFIVAKLLPGIHIKSFWTALIVAIVYSFINFLTGWLLTLLTLPFIIITFGLFKLVINAFMLWVTDKILDDFKIDGLLYTFIAAVLITLIDSVIKWII